MVGYIIFTISTETTPISTKPADGAIVVLLPETLHIRLHSILRRARLDWDMSIRDLVLDAYIRGFDGDYIGNMEWFSLYTQIISELAFWGKMKALRYRSEITGAMLPLEGITEYAKF